MSASERKEIADATIILGGAYEHQDDEVQCFKNLTIPASEGEVGAAAFESVISARERGDNGALKDPWLSEARDNEMATTFYIDDW